MAVDMNCSIRKRPVNPKGIAALLVATVAFVTSPADRAEAQVPSPALKSKMSLRYRRARSGAPLPVIWKIEWKEAAIGRGALEYEVYDENERLGEFRIPDFVLSPGKNEFNLLLPSFFVNSTASLLTIRSRFATSKENYELAEQSLRVPTRYVQWFSVGRVIGAQAALTETELRYFDKIRLENFLDESQTSNQSTTAGFELRTADLPADPLTLCSFDVLVLTPTALAELRDDQAGGLRKWVRAGGSLCVVTEGGLQPRHAELLNDLTSESSTRAKFVVGPKGFLLPDDDAPGTILTVSKGLGRVAILRPKLLEIIEPGAKTWIETARFLLKGRKRSGPIADMGSQLAQPRAGRASLGGSLRPGSAATPPPMPVSPVWGVSMPMSSLSAAPLGHLDELFQLLMPVGASTIPLSVIVLILAAYVVTIGPIDYFALGALRLRRFTWVLFPVVTVGFAAYTLWLSQRYLGSTDSRRAIEIYDVVPGGAVARRTRIEMLFLSQENTVATQVDNGAFALVGRGMVMGRGPMPRMPITSAPQPVGVDDRFPTNYRVVQQIAQWRPVLNRFFWIDPKPSAVYQPPELPGAAGFDWEAASDLTGSPGGVSLGERVRRAFGPNACAFVLRGPSVIYILNDLNEFRHWRSSLAMGRQPTEPIETVRELCQRTPDQLFAYTSTLSPNGGPELDDLALADATDAQQSVLVIAVETDSTLHLYRRVYSGRP
jgi:hypothetical protein